MNHSISSSGGGGGIVTFYNADTVGSSVQINTTNLASALTYLGSNITGIGRTVAFNYDSDNNGSDDALVVFQNDIVNGDISAVLKGISGAFLNTSAGLGVVQLVDNTAPRVTLDDASFTTSGGNNTVSFTMSENVALTSGMGPTTGFTLTKNGTTTLLTVTGASVTGAVITFTVNEALASTDYVVVSYNGGGNVQDLSGNSVGPSTLVIDGSGSNTLNFQFQGFSFFPVRIRGNAGDDIITGTGGIDAISGRAGSDTINGSWGADTIGLAETPPASDTVVLGGDGESNRYGRDRIFDFDVTGTTNNDVLNLPSNTIAAAVTNANGVDSGILKGHNIATGGIISFRDADSGGNTIPINALNVGAALDYLGANSASITLGQTVAFAYDSDSDGSADSSVVYQATGRNQNGNIQTLAAELIGVTGVTLATSAAAAALNVVRLFDTTRPHVIDVSFGTGANAPVFFTFSENVFLGAGTSGLILLNGSGLSIVTGQSTTGNVFTASTTTTLAQTDWLLVTVGDNIRDATENVMEEAGAVVALGGSGNNTINVSGGGVNYIAGFAGNDTIIGSAAVEEFEGGLGADNLNGGPGADDYYFAQGDSPGVTFAENGGAGVSTGDTFSFAGGVAELISGGFTDRGQNGDRIELSTDSEGVQSLTPMAAPANGLVTDQNFFLVRGNLSGGTFTVDTGAGGSTLVVYDGNSSLVGGVSHTALVLSGIEPGLLIANFSQIYLS